MPVIACQNAGRVWWYLHSNHQLWITLTWRRFVALLCWYVGQLLACIGEQFTEGEEICGIVVNMRAKQDKLCLWSKTAANEASQVDTISVVSLVLRSIVVLLLDALPADLCWCWLNIQWLMCWSYAFEPAVFWAPEWSIAKGCKFSRFCFILLITLEGLGSCLQQAVSTYLRPDQFIQKKGVGKIFFPFQSILLFFSFSSTFFHSAGLTPLEKEGTAKAMFVFASCIWLMNISTSVNGIENVMHYWIRSCNDAA